MAVAELLETPVTAFAMTDVPQGYELIDGQLVEMPDMGYKASRVAGRVFKKLDDWCEEKKVGIAATAEAPYACFPDNPHNTRKPDVSVILCDPDTFVEPERNCTVVPDLIVEVISPTNRMQDISERIDDFFAVGTKLIWVIDPDLRYAMIHHPDDTIKKIREAGSLTGEHVLPGFTLPLAEILPKA